MKTLTIKQKMVLEFVSDFIMTKGYSPTVREICQALGFRYPNSVFTILLNLEIKGYISTTSGKSRTITILKGIDE